MQTEFGHLNSRISRRRALTTLGLGASGVAAAALLGCSAGSKGAASPTTTAKTASTATTSQPKPGGTLKYPIPKDPDSLDPYRLAAAVGGTQLAANVYSRLLTFEPGVGKQATGNIIGDIASKWEQPDAQTIIFRLNPAAKWDAKPPLNGRAVTAADVVASWKRFAESYTTRTRLANALNKDAPIVSFEAVDPSTVRVKMAFPDSTALALIAGDLWIQPEEGIAGKIDLSKEARGSGPFMLDNYKASVSLTYKRNPTWHLGEGKMPYVDGLNVSIIPDQAQFETQFRSKNLQFASVSTTNIPQFAKELKDTEIAVSAPDTQSPAWAFGYSPSQPWHDVRLRRALSMALDRDKFADVIYNPKQFEAVGAKLNIRWNTPLAGGYGQYWLDPRDKAKFGPSVAYLQHNVAESMKLLAAAGYSSSKPLEFDVVYPGVYYGTDQPTRVEIWQSMAKEAGFKVNASSVDYATDYVPKYLRAKAQFEGKVSKNAVQYPPGGANPDPVLWFLNYLHGAGSSSFVGKEFPELDTMIVKTRGLVDRAERTAAILDISRYATDNMVCVPTGPATEQVDLVWKALRGPQLYQPFTNSVPVGVSANTYLFPNFWFDQPM